MIPILQAPGVMIPGQFGPISRAFLPHICAFTRIMSITGIPSVMHTTRSRSASTASKIESAAAGAGTKIIETLQFVFSRASHTVSNTGTFPSNISPPLPGVTPATTFVPYSMQPLAWNAPELPVIPWTRSLVLLSTRIDMGFECLPSVSLMDADRIPVRIRDNCHSTDGAFERLNNEFYVVCAKFAHGRIEIVDLESNSWPIARRLPFLLRHIADGKSRRVQVVFYPMPVWILNDPGWLEFQYTFVKRSGALHFR